LRGGDVADPTTLFTGGEPEPDQQMGLARAGVAEQHDRLTGVHVVPGCELPQGGGLDRRDSIDVEVCESFQAWELGVVDPPCPASFGAVIDFGGEHFGEVGQVRLSFPYRDFRQSGCFGADGGKVQLARSCADRGLRCGVDGRARGGHGPLPVNSWS
jgi:hypothetical protein